VVPGSLVGSWGSGDESGTRVSRKTIEVLTKHDVSCTDKDDIEITGTTDVRSSMGELSGNGSYKREGTNLSIGISLDGSIEGRLDAPDEYPDPRLSAGLRSEPRREAGCFVEVISRVDESLRVEAILSILR
jgi:hypothetical protein